MFLALRIFFGVSKRRIAFDCQMHVASSRVVALSSYGCDCTILDCVVPHRLEFFNDVWEDVFVCSLSLLVPCL